MAPFDIDCEAVSGSNNDATQGNLGWHKITLCTNAEEAIPTNNNSAGSMLELTHVDWFGSSFFGFKPTVNGWQH